jgi:hypothetical protein
MRRFLVVLILLLTSSCASQTHLVRFPASGTARVNLSGMEHLGIICFITARDIDRSFEKKTITSKIADTVADGLRLLPDKKIVSHDEMKWLFRTDQPDSAMVLAPENLKRLRDELKLDGLILVDIGRLDARLQRMLYPIGGPASGTYTSGPPIVYMGIEMTFRILDVRTQTQIWKKTYKGSGAEPIRLQLFGSGAEQQVMDATFPAIRQFILQVLPPRREAVRGFVIAD